MTRVGKIARLPLEVREQLNDRLRNGEKGKLLVKWLNSLPEVATVMAAQFGGRAVTEPNLSEWKTGGYQDWLRKHETLAEVQRVTAQTGNLKAAQAGLADHLAFWITARHLVAAQGLGNGKSGDKEFKMLRAMSKDLDVIRRREHYATKLESQPQKQSE